MAFIKLKKVWEDDDSMLQLELAASNDLLATTQDFYIYPDDFSAFAKQLENFFPKLGKGEVVLKYGSEVSNYYAYVLCKVTYKKLGELNIEIRTNNNSENKDESTAIAHFFSSISNQELNNLGKKLVTWTQNMEQPFSYEWQNT
ncbi:hypothetical protein ACJJID_06095 [Microbulbifer sp. CnH-101-G]|uniref:hypothetical protein n=1 Tax=Microbulbifer sp. CnH-101-G TaxID=3243393 RepID=UPI00403A0AFA